MSTLFCTNSLYNNSEKKKEFNLGPDQEVGTHPL